MKSSKLDISAPLSRNKKSKSILQVFKTTPLLFKVLIVLVTFVITYIFFGTTHDYTTKTIKTRQTLEKPYFQDESKHLSYFGDSVRGHHPIKDKQQQQQLQEYVTLSTSLGNIKIKFRPDLSKESVDYIRNVAKEGCDRCALYRTEPPGIFQGIIKSDTIPIIQQKGNCPDEFKAKQQDCPEHDPNCGCHGPIMTKGMVGWAGGKTGADFFMDTYDKPAKFWENQHTVWGEIEDEKSFQLIEKIYTLPRTNKGGMHFLDKEIKFQLIISSQEEI